MLGFWVVMNIINSGALHVCYPHQVWPLRRSAVGEQQLHTWHVLECT